MSNEQTPAVTRKQVMSLARFAEEIVDRATFDAALSSAAYRSIMDGAKLGTTLRGLLADSAWTVEACDVEMMGSKLYVYVYLRGRGALGYRSEGRLIGPRGGVQVIRSETIA